MDDPQYQDYVKRTFRYVDENGRQYRIDNLANPAFRPNLIYEYKGYLPPKNGWAISKEKMEQWDSEGRLHFPKSSAGRIQRRRFLDEIKGKPVQNLWDDIKMVSSQATERTGFPTQKPLALYERIIRASSNEGDMVLDPFAGCATTPVAAERLGRQWGRHRHLGWCCQHRKAAHGGQPAIVDRHPRHSLRDQAANADRRGRTPPYNSFR